MTKSYLIFLAFLVPLKIFAQWEEKAVTSTTSFLAVDIHESGICYAVGYPFMKSEDAGETWAEVEFPGLDSLYFNFMVLNDVKILSETTTIAVGWHFLNNNNIIIRTDDGGVSWSLVYEGAMGTGLQFQAVDFYTDLVGVAVGDNGLVYRTVDGGVSWSYTPPGSTVDFKDVTFLTSSRVIAVGSGKILRSFDSGATWVVQTHTDKYFHSVRYSAIDNKVTATYRLGPDFDSYLFTSVDLGVTWSSQNIDYGYINCHEILDNDSIVFGFGYDMYLGLTEDHYMYKFLDYEFEGVSALEFKDGYGLAVTQQYDESKIYKFYYSNPWALEQNIDFSFPDTICEGSSIHYSITNPTLESYEWLVDDVAVSTDPELDYIHPEAGLFTVKLVTEFEGNSDTVEHAVTVIGSPLLGPIEISSVTSICQGSDYEFNLINIADGTGFRVVKDEVELMFASAAGFNRYYDLGETVEDLTFTVTKWIINECDSIAASEDFTLSVFAYPDSSNLFNAVDSLVCYGDSTVMVIPSPELGVTYTIFQDGDSIAGGVSLDGSPLSFYSHPLYTTHEFSVEAINEIGCHSEMDLIDYSSVEEVSANFDIGLGYYYQDSLVTINTDGIVGAYYDWSVSGVPSLLENTDLLHPDIAYDENGYYELKLIVETEFAGCQDSLIDTLAIFISTPPDSTDLGQCFVKDANRIEVLGQTIDRFGNIILVGYKRVNGYGGDMTGGVIQKYDSEGNLLWEWVSERYSPLDITTKSIMYSSVTTDQFGNIYFTGSADLQRFLYRDSVLFLKSDYNYCIPCDTKISFIIKTNSNGDFIWMNFTHVGTSPAEGFADILYDEETDRLFVSSIKNASDVDWKLIFSNLHGEMNLENNTDKLRIFEFDQTGLLLSNYHGSAGLHSLSINMHAPLGISGSGFRRCFTHPTIEMGIDKRIYVAGPVSSGVTLDGFGPISGTGTDYLAVLDPYAADPGWVNAIMIPGSSYNQYAKVSTTLDSENNIYVAVYTSNIDDPYVGKGFSIHKFDSDLNLIWTRFFENMYLRDIIHTQNEEIVFIGSTFENNAIYADDQPLFLTEFNGDLRRQMILGSISLDGDIVWFDDIGQNFIEAAFKLATSNCGDVVMSGKSSLRHPGVPPETLDAYYQDGKNMQVELINTVYLDSINGNFLIKISDSLCIPGGCGTLCDEEDDLPSPEIYGAGLDLTTDEYVTYQWYKDGVLIPGATSQTYLADDLGNYKVVVMDLNGCGGESEAFTVTCDDGVFYPEPTITNLGTMLTTEVYASYQWFLNGIAIPGAVDQTLFFTDPGLYTVEVTNDYDCMATSDIFDLTNLSIDYVDLAKLSIYPNPSNGHVTISYELAVGSTIMLEIKDVSGKTLYSLDASDLSAGSYEHQLDLRSFASGIYFAIIRVNADMVINKLIIQ